MKNTCKLSSVANWVILKILETRADIVNDKN